MYQLPAPVLERQVFNNCYSLCNKAFSKMSKEERVRACYHHACLQWVSGGSFTNSSLRKRFDIPKTKLSYGIKSNKRQSK